MAYVMTESGAVAGRRSAGVTAFLGLPYAAPPTGARRFAPAEPVAPWTGVRDATRFGASAPQPGSVRARLVLGRSAPSDEECLFLNVWTPLPRSGAGLPVLVWLHGGAFTNGSGDVAALRGAAFAARAQAVVVTVNYRLGVFGFGHHPALRGRANLGLYDQQAALGWVRRNIEAFGGDPDRVTLAGESAGAMCAGLHALLPTSRGLFAQLAMHSGTPALIAEPAAAAATERLAAALGVGVMALRHVDPALLVRESAALRFAPVAAGELLTSLPELHRSAPPRPTLISTTADEGTFFLVDDRAPRWTTEAEAVALLATMTGGDGRRHYTAARTRMDAGRREVPHWVLARALTDAVFADGADRWSAATSAPVWRSRYVRPATLWDGWLGATHTIDVPVLLGTYPAPELSGLYAGDDRIGEVSARLGQSWAAFLHTGSPATGSSSWPAWTMHDRHIQTLGTL